MTPSPSKLRMDVFVAGLGRAGTTLLANLMTSPPRRWVLVEPGVTRHDMGDHVRLQAAQFGLAISEEEWKAVSNEDALARFERLIEPGLSGLERWGVKEVNPAGWDELLIRFAPRHVVLMVRDLRDAAASVLEKEDRGMGPRKTRDWLFDRLGSAARELVRLRSALAPAGLTVVRYEDLVTSPDERRRIEERLGWPLDGRPDQRLGIYGRSYESDRHAGTVTASSVRRALREPSPEYLDFAERLRRGNEAFARVFGYD